MNAFRVIFLTLVFAFSMLFLVQNSQVLDTRDPLLLNLWLAELSTPAVSFYVFVFVCFVTGLIFGLITFLPGNREVKDRLHLVRLKSRQLKGEILNMHKEHEKALMKDEPQQEPQHDSESQAESIPPSDEPRPYSKPSPAGGIAGITALAGVIILFAVGAYFYYCLHERLNETAQQNHLTLEMVSENTAGIGQLNSQGTFLLEEVYRVEALVSEQDIAYQEAVEQLGQRVDEHEQIINALRNIPRQTADYITLLLIHEYTSRIEYLREKAPEEDQETLNEVLQSLESALEHYRIKID
ncbi:hypothetical protein [Desulfonatronovibrio magnus]|uniref:hypothetical protein n=1 Tax=Desulfonatronovibrio magnus TaxID=698827 RepID=UPI0005EB2CC8|nr:hypothetical protein [Desulfonatronovibrio magnus]